MDCFNAVAKYAILTLLHIVFTADPFMNVQSLSTFTAQPITVKVPKNQINNLKQEFQTNPMYLQQLLSQSASPNGIGQPVSLTTAGLGGTRGLINSPSLINSYPSVGQGPFTVAVPKVTTIGGQKFFLTSRANLFWNKGANFLKNIASTVISPSSTKLTPTSYFNNENGLNQGNVAKVITNDKINKYITEEDDADDDEEEEEEERVEEEEIRSTKKSRNKGNSNKNKNNVRKNKTLTKNDSSPEANSERENSSDNEEQSEEIIKRKSNDGRKKNDRSSVKKRDESTASASASASGSGSGSYSGSASE